MNLFRFLGLVLSFSFLASVLAQVSPDKKKLSPQEKVEKLIEKMSKAMYDPMEHGLEEVECKAKIALEKPMLMTLVFSLKVSKDAPPELKVLSVSPPEMAQLSGMMSQSFSQSIGQAFTGSYTELLRPENQEVKITKEKNDEGEDQIVVQIESEQKKNSKITLYLNREFRVVRQITTMSVPDPMDPSGGSFQEMERESHIVWKEIEKDRWVREKVKMINEMTGEQEILFSYDRIDTFTMVSETLLEHPMVGKLPCTYSDFKLKKKEKKEEKKEKKEEKKEKKEKNK